MSLAEGARSWWWLVSKDALREYRAPRVWPGMLLLGIVLVLIIEMQIDLPASQQRGLVGGLFWMAMFFAGTVTLDRSIAGEREQESWQGLLLYPVSPGTLFLAKTTVNFVALCALALVLAPIFAIFTGAPLLARPWSLLAVVVVANLGYAAVGTLMSAVTNGLAQRNSLLMLLLLPLASPLMLAAAQATRAILNDVADEGWRWTQFLGCFAALFLTVGTLVFDWITEE